jgi:coproporphyrinogen III oxidase-like Fe-S oxidoreductase
MPIFYLGNISPETNKNLMLKEYLQKKIYKRLTGENELIMSNIYPSVNELHDKFRDINEMGIYLHIPFCTRICPYCPYNKEIFKEEVCQNYVHAVTKEIDTYVPILKSIPVTSFYIGGGTPTTMLKKGIEKIINHIYKHLNMNCYVHMESHPNHLTAENLKIIESLNVKYLSIGVEALQDHHLRALERPYTVNEVKQNIDRAVNRNFDCVNTDLIFDLPGQTESEIEQAGHDIIKLGVQQAATYPLFRFHYTRFGEQSNNFRNKIITMFRRRKLMKILEDIFYDSDYYRSSVWAFTKKGIDKYCSVTVPLYLGFGASGSSYLRDIYYVNTFNIGEYIKAINERKSPVALSANLSEEMQMAGWLYWRIYETRFKKSDFYQRFNAGFDEKYGLQMEILNRLGYLKNSNDKINLTDKGAYWIHAFEDFFSIDFINKLWGSSIQNPWPDKVVLTAN